MKTIPFRKMHGLGNDFVVIDVRSTPLDMTPSLARALADRRRGVGGDEVILIEPSANATARMGIWNPDGEEVDACGNASRCVAALLMAETGQSKVTLSTNAGTLQCSDAGGGMVTVDMGLPRFNWRDIPLSQTQDALRLKLDTTGIEGPTLPPPAGVSMGNPHAIFFVDDMDKWDLAAIGPKLECNPLFPERANITLAQQTGPASFKMRVWERGSGLTLACGTAACATLVTASKHGLTGRKGEMTLPGGVLHIEWREGDGHVLMTGPWAQSFTGEFDPGAFA
jgi:diaminopimelate epimerase